jgi:hypothetical protein
MYSSLYKRQTNIVSTIVSILSVPRLGANCLETNEHVPAENGRCRTNKVAISRSLQNSSTLAATFCRIKERLIAPFSENCGNFGVGAVVAALA